MSVSSAPSTAPASHSAPAAASLVRRAGTAIPAALLAGALLGALAWLSDDLGYPLGLLIPANLVGVWAIVAFGAGAGARTVIGGTGRGLFALLAAVAVYYLAYGLLGDGWRAAGAVRAATVWGAVALIAGPPLGLSGSVWRHRTGWARSLAIAVPGRRPHGRGDPVPGAGPERRCRADAAHRRSARGCRPAARRRLRCSLACDRARCGDRRRRGGDRRARS